VSAHEVAWALGGTHERSRSGHLSGAVGGLLRCYGVRGALARFPDARSRLGARRFDHAACFPNLGLQVEEPPTSSSTGGGRVGRRCAGEPYPPRGLGPEVASSQPVAAAASR